MMHSLSLKIPLTRRNSSISYFRNSDIQFIRHTNTVERVVFPNSRWRYDQKLPPPTFLSSCQTTTEAVLIQTIPGTLHEQDHGYGAKDYDCGLDHIDAYTERSLSLDIAPIISKPCVEHLKVKAKSSGELSTATEARLLVKNDCSKSDSILSETHPTVLPHWKPDPQSTEYGKFLASDRVTSHPIDPTFTWFDLIFNIFSIVTYCFDVGSDIFLACLYFLKEDWWWFGLTVTFIALSSITATAFSLKWYLIDHKTEKISAKVWTCRILFMIFQVTPVVRYIDTIRYGLKGKKAEKYETEVRRKHWLTLMVYEGTDSALLRMMESFIEAAPQLVLQLYILCESQGIEGGLLQFTGQSVAIATSLASVSWAIAAYQKSLRASLVHIGKAKIPIPSLILLFFWHFFIIGTRILSLAMFTTHFKWMVCFLIIAHWMIMFCWILLMRTHFCDTKCEELVFNMVMSVVYIFSYVNLFEGHTRIRYLFYYTLIYIENVAMVIIWKTYRDDGDGFGLPIVLIVVIGFLIGLSFQMLYYLCCHPNNYPPYNKTKQIRINVPLKELHLVQIKSLSGNDETPVNDVTNSFDVVDH